MPRLRAKRTVRRLRDRRLGCAFDLHALLHDKFSSWLDFDHHDGLYGIAVLVERHRAGHSREIPCRRQRVANRRAIERTSALDGVKHNEGRVVASCGEPSQRLVADRVLNWDVVTNSHFFYSVNRVGRDLKASGGAEKCGRFL